MNGEMFVVSDEIICSFVVYCVVFDKVCEKFDDFVVDCVVEIR